MAEEGACPICGFERLLTDQDICPQCDSDLKCFKVLDSIPEESVKPISEHQSSIISIQREPSIAALEEELFASEIEAKPESVPEKSTTNSDLIHPSEDAPVEVIVPESETPSTKQESKQSTPKTSSGLIKRLIPKGPSWNQAAAMLTFAVILIAIVSIFQLYHLRRLESDLQEQSRNKKITLNSEPGKRSRELASSELAEQNQQPLLGEKARPKTGSGSDKALLNKAATDIQKTPKNSEKIKFTAITDETTNFKDKQKPYQLIKPSGKSDSGQKTILKPEPTGVLPSDSATEDQVEPKVAKTLSEHDFKSIMIKTGDTLKSVAKTYYGAAKYYPLVIILNPGIEIDLQGRNKAIQIKVLNDRHKAAELYRKNTSTIGNRLYFSYTITKGDTLKIISLKFYRSPRMIKSILDLNPDSKFRPGEQIRIRLE